MVLRAGLISAACALLFVGTAAASITAGDLSFAPWTRTSGVVSHGGGWPPGPWASYGSLPIAAATSVPSENCFVTATAGTAAVNAVVKAFDADTGAVRWSFDAGAHGIDEFAFVESMPLAFGAPRPFAIVVAPLLGRRVFLLDSKTGRQLSNVTLPGLVGTTGAFLRGNNVLDSTPLPPFSSHLGATLRGVTTPIGVAVSRDANEVYIFTTAPDGADATRASSVVDCGMNDGRPVQVRAIAHRGGGRFVVQCPQVVQQYDVFTSALRSIPAAIDAITTIEQSATAAEGAPPHPVSATVDAVQDVYFAAYSALQSSIVIGTLDFATNSVSECTVIRTAARPDIRSIRVLADNGTAPTVRAIVLQTSLGLTTLTPPSEGAGCPWAQSWHASYSAIGYGVKQTGIPGPRSDVVVDFGAVTVLPVQQPLGLPSVHLIALRLSAEFFIIDALAKTVVWAAAAPGGVRCYQHGQFNPLLVVMAPALDRVLLGCPAVSFVAKLPDTALYAAGMDIAPGTPPPFATQAGHIVGGSPLVAAPQLFADTVVAPHVDQVATAYAGGASFSVQATYAKAELNGVVFAMNALPNAGTVASITTVGAAGQDVWDRRDFPIPRTTFAAVLQPFGGYLLAAMRGWELYVLNASTGATVTSFAMPTRCQQGTQRPLQFENFVAVDPNFAAHEASGLPSDASVATAVVFSFGSCELILDQALTLSELHPGAQSSAAGPTLYRAQLSASHVACVTPLGTLRLYDVSAAAAHRFLWEVQPPVLTAAASNADQRAQLRMRGNVIAVATGAAVSALLAANGTTLWVDVHAGELSFFMPPSLAIYGSTVIVTTRTCVTGYHVAPQPVDEAVHPNTKDGLEELGTAPQQVQWRQFLTEFHDNSAGGAARLSQYGRYIVAHANWVAAVHTATGAVVWKVVVPPAAWGAFPGGVHGIEGFAVGANIVAVSFAGSASSVWQLDEATGTVLQATATARAAFDLTFSSGRLSFLIDDNTAAPLVVVTWPTFTGLRRVLPLPPAVPAVPETHVVVTPTFQRPTYAPATRPPMPNFTVQVDPTLAPPLRWSVPWGGVRLSAGVAASANALIRFDWHGPVLRAHSLDDDQIVLWEVPVQNCDFEGGSLGSTVYDEAGIVIATCPTFMVAFNTTNGHHVWGPVPLHKPACAAFVIPRYSPTFNHWTTGIVMTITDVTQQSSVISGLNVTTGAAVWTTTVPHQVFRVGSSFGGPGLPAQLGEGSAVGPNTLLFTAQGYIIVAPSTGAFFGPVVKVATGDRRRLAVAMDFYGKNATTVDLATARPTGDAGPLNPPLEYTRGANPVGVNCVVLDLSRRADLLLAAPHNGSTIIAYQFNATTASYNALWSASAADVCRVAGCTLDTMQIMGLSQPSWDIADNSVFGVLTPPRGTAGNSVFFRVSLRDGDVVTAVPFASPVSSEFLLSEVINPGRRPVQFVFRSRHHAALIDAFALTTVYTIDQYAFSDLGGFGVVVPAGTDHLFVVPTARNILRFTVSPVDRTLVSGNTTIVATVTDGTGDFVVASGNSVLIRRGTVGPDAGVVRWKAYLPKSLVGGGVPLRLTVSDNSVVIFAQEGVFFYDLRTGAVTTVPLSVLRKRCPLDDTMPWSEVKVLDHGSVGHSSKIPAPASTHAAVLGRHGRCAFFFNPGKDLTVYRIPSSAEGAILGMYTIYAPAGSDQAAVMAVLSGGVERWALPGGFLAPNYHAGLEVVKSWTVDLQGRAMVAAVAVVASDTLFVSSATALAAVDLRRGVLLWRFVEYTNSKLLPMHVCNGILFMLSTPPAPMPSYLVALDAITLETDRRVLKYYPVETPAAAPYPMLQLVNNRVVVVQSGTDLVGVDAVTLALRWTVPGPAVSSRKAELWAVPVVNSRSLDGAFIAAAAFSDAFDAVIYDSATGGRLATIPGPTAPLQTFGTACITYGYGRCSTVMTDVERRTVATLIPTDAAVSTTLPAAPLRPSALVPAGYRYTEPAPANLPPSTLNYPNAGPPRAHIASGLPDVPLGFLSHGVIVSVTLQGVVATNAATGAIAWRAEFPASVATLCQKMVSMARGSSFLVVMFGCVRGGGVRSVIYSVANGALVSSVLIPDAAPPAFGHRLGATLGRTVCHNVKNTTTSGQSIACHDTTDHRLKFFECPLKLDVRELRLNAAGTALVMSCGGIYSVALKVDSATDVVLWTAGPTPLRMTDTIVQRYDVHTVFVPAVLLLAKATLHVDLTIVDSDTGRGHRYTHVFAEWGAEALGAATALSTRYAALQTSQRWDVVDVVAGTVVASRVFAGSAGAGVMKLSPDGVTLFVVDIDRRLVGAYNLTTNATLWEDVHTVQPAAGSDFVIVPVSFGGGHAIAVDNQQLYFFAGNNGQHVWVAPSTNIVAATPACLWTFFGCFDYAPAPTLRTAAPVQTITANTKAVIVGDGQNLYALPAVTPRGALPQPTHVTPSWNGVSGAFAFGGPDNGRFVVAAVASRYWVFDTEASLAAVYGFDFPQSTTPPAGPQTAVFGYAVAAPALHGGAAYIPGSGSGVLALIASTVGAKTTFAMKFRPTVAPVHSALSLYRRTIAAGEPMPRRNCGVVVPLGGGAAALDCADLTTWWATPTPAVDISIPPVVAGDYVLYSGEDRLVYASVITGQTVWRSAPVFFPHGTARTTYIWNNTAFAVLMRGQDRVLYSFDLDYDRTGPAALEHAPTMVAEMDSPLHIFAAGHIVSMPTTGIQCRALNGTVVWALDKVYGDLAEMPPFEVVDGTVYIGNPVTKTLTGFGLHDGWFTFVTELPNTNALIRRVAGMAALAVSASRSLVQVLDVTAAPPLPPAPRGPAFGLPPASYPAASPTTTPAPTLAPGVVLPSLGCVSRVVGASEDFVTCVDRAAQSAYAAAFWGPRGATFQTCPAATVSLHDCGTSYLAKMGLGCPAGAAHVKALFADLRASRLFGACPAAGPAQCGDGGKSAALCDVMKGDMTVAGVATLKPGQHLAAGFEFPQASAFAAAPQRPTAEPTPLPSTPHMLATTFALLYPPAAQPDSAATIGARLQGYLRTDEVVVRILHMTGTVADGVQVVFNVTSSNAQQVAVLLNHRTEASTARFFGAAQFAPYLAAPQITGAPGSAPPSAPPSKIDPMYIAVAAVVGAVLSALIVGTVVFVVMRRSARAGNSSMAGPPAVLSQRELKSMNEAMLTDAASPYEEA